MLGHRDSEVEPPLSGQEAAFLLCLHCLFSGYCHQPGEEETGPAVSSICSVTSVEGLVLFLFLFLCLSLEYLVIVSAGTERS